MFLHDESSQPSPPAPGYQWIPLFWSKVLLLTSVHCHLPSCQSIL